MFPVHMQKKVKNSKGILYLLKNRVYDYKISTRKFFLDFSFRLKTNENEKKRKKRMKPKKNEKYE